MLETKEVSKVFNTKVGKCIRVYEEEFNWIENYYSKYRAVPSVDVIKRKFPDFEMSPTDSTLEYLIDEVSNDFLQYKLGSLLEQAAVKVQDSPRDALNYIFAKTAALGHQTDVVKDVNLAEDYFMRVNSLRHRAELSENGAEILGIRTSIDPIDYLFGGWQRGDFVTLMGWTGAQKTWLATYFAVEAWKSGKVPLYFSLEMDDIQFGYRVDTLMAQGELSNTSLINARNINADSYENWARKNYSDRQPFYIVTNEGLDECNQFTVQSKIEQYRPDVVYIDYHSLLDDGRNGKSETERHRNLSKDLKRMAVRYGVPIIDVVAVTMDSDHGLRPPELNEVAWSKQLAYDSDLVLSVCKEGDIQTVEAKKSRRCETFAFKLQWNIDAGTVVPVNDW